MVIKNSVRFKRRSSSELKIWPGKQQNFTRRTINLLGACSTGLLIVVVMMLLVPTVGSVSATSTDSTTTVVNALVKPSISLSAPSSLNLELMPDAESEFASASGTVMVSTNNASGYRLLVNSTSTNTLVSYDNASNNPNDVINSIDTNSIPSNFKDNTWGYYLGKATVDDATTYSPLSTIATEALKTDTSSTDTSSTSYYNLAFGTKVSNTLPAGTYSNSVVISAVANPLEIHSLSDLTFMQDMTTSICAETPSAYNSATGITDKTSTYYANPVTKQLIDLRDGKKYWVAKLADGECWMTQNLALNLGTAPDSETEARLGRFVPKLTPADSDVTEEWVPSSSTNEVRLEGETIKDIVKDDSSWNYGEILFATPLALTGAQCDVYGEDSGVVFNYKTGDDLGENCAKVGVVNVANWQATFTSQSGKYEYDADTNQVSTIVDSVGDDFITVDTQAKTYDAHYLMGNLYRNVGALAMTEGQTNVENMTAPGSICPKGWRLPDTELQRSDDGVARPLATNSAYRLFLAYGYPTADGYNIDNVQKTLIHKIIDRYENSPSNIVAPPIHFVNNSMLINYAHGYGSNIGTEGRLLSSTYYTSSGLGSYSYFISGSIMVWVGKIS